MRSKLTRFSKDFIKSVICAPVAQQKVLSDYDILKDRESGMTLSQIAIRHGISRRHVCRILADYK